MRCVFVLMTLAVVTASYANIQDERSTELFGELRLIDEVIPGEEQSDHEFTESRPGISRVETILGKPTRIVVNEGDKGRYVAYTLGAGKGLKANKAYVLIVEFPEDEPRSMFIHNRGSETARGVHTGPTAGDVLDPRYVDSNVESLQYPLSGGHERFEMLFFLQSNIPGIKTPRGHEHPRNRTPDQGIPVIISQFKSINAPLSQGAAFSRIALYEVIDPSKLKAEINFPPDDLPRRHLFFREEMSNSTVGKTDPGYDDRIDFFRGKAELSQFLGMNTYALELLEFGHNHGWDAKDPDWVYASFDPHREEKILRMLREEGYDLTILPFYEYAGGMGKNAPGMKKLARPLGDTEAYTHVTWSERGYADITEPVILEDAKKVLDLTILRWTGLADFQGAWFRVRPSHIPVSFSDNALAKFSSDTGYGVPITREQLREGGPLYDQYIAWWQDQRKAFFIALRDHLRTKLGDDTFILFTADWSEPGVSLLGQSFTEEHVPRGDSLPKVVTDDLSLWREAVREKDLKVTPVPFDEVVANEMHLDAQLLPAVTWEQWEWQHSVPRADPANYKDTEGIMMSYTFNRVYTVSSPVAFEAFRAPAGLAIIRHFTLNENEMEEQLGYFVSDTDRNGPYSMYAEAIAMANGDPTHIGYLTSHSFNRGFPWYVRRFNRAFLSLPALPSEIVSDAADDEEVVVRLIQTQDHGAWLSVVNTGMRPKASVTITLPIEGQASDAVTGEEIQTTGGRVELSLDAAELRTIRVQ